MPRRADITQPTDDQIEAALRSNAGLYSYAATSLCISNSTVGRRIAKSEHLQSVVKEINEVHLDLAVNGLVDALVDKAPWAVKLYINTKGRTRGFIHSNELSGPDQGPIKIDLSDEDLQKIIDKE